MSDIGPAAKIADLDLVGGTLCADFINSHDGREDWLTDYERLVCWGVHAGALDASTADRLRSRSTARPALAEAVLRRGCRLRSALGALFTAVAERASPSATDLETLNRELSIALGRSELVPQGDGFVLTHDAGAADLDRVLWPVVRSAADVLTTDACSRIKVCDGESCTWVFLDTSRNRRRRWCDMSGCGNRAKARRHYRRSKSRGGTREVQR